MDRDEFVRGMIAALSSRKQDSAAWKGRERTAEDVFRQLCFDMPSVSQTDLETLNAALRMMVLEEDRPTDQHPAQWFSLQPAVVENLLYLASEHQNAGSAENGARPLQSVASQLCATMVVEVPLYLLQRDRKACAQLLAGYIEPQDAAKQDSSQAAPDDNGPAFELPKHAADDGESKQPQASPSQPQQQQQQQQQQNEDEHIYAAEEDPDDFVFEGDPSQTIQSAGIAGDLMSAARPGSSPSSASVAATVAAPTVTAALDADHDWPSIEQALLRLWRQLSYGCLSAIDHSTWEATSLTATFCQIVRVLRQPAPAGAEPQDRLGDRLENKVELWSTCAFILRERMLHHPQTIPTILEALLRVLDSRLLAARPGRRPKQQTPVEEVISASIVGALCQAVRQPQHALSREYLQSFVSQRFDLLVDTIELLLKEDLVSGIDILCSCIGLVIGVDFESCKIIKTPASQQFDQLLTSRAVAVAVSTFVKAVRTAAESVDGALVAGLKKLELTITALTFLSPSIANFVVRFPGYVQLFAAPAALHERVLVYIINPLVRMRVCLAAAVNSNPLPPEIAGDVKTMLQESIPIALSFDHAFARAAFTEDTCKTLQLLGGLAPTLFSIKSSHPEIGSLLQESLEALLQRLREWNGAATSDQTGEDDTTKATCYLSSATQATCIASLKSAVSRLQGESSNKID